MSVKHVSTSGVPQPRGAYSQAVVANGFLYTAGLGPLDPHTAAVVGDDAGAQTRQVLANLTALLAERGLDFTDVVKVTVHLADLARDFAAFDAAFRDVVAAPYPVRTTVGSILANILVEIDVVAAMRD